MSTPSDNESLVRSMIDAFLRGDLEAVGATFADDATWDFPGNSILNGTYHGGTLALDVFDVTSSNAGACHAQWVSADHDGRSFRSVEVLHHEIENGKIVRTWHRSDDVAITGFFGAA
jgi:ketosteroid isomerase-like protein